MVTNYKGVDYMNNTNTPEGNWERIKGHENYLISDDGRVYSRYSNRLLSIATKENKYKYVNLWKGNKQKAKYVHRLVLQHFSDEKPKETANHKDGNKNNNHISNLEWATYSENNVHALKTGLRKSNRNNKNMSTPVEQRDSEGNLIKVYPSLRQAQRETGADATAIGHSIRKGWMASGYRWYLEGQYKETNHKQLSLF